MRALRAVAIVVCCGGLATSSAFLCAGEPASLRVGVADSMATVSRTSAQPSAPAEAAGIAWQQPVRVQLAKNEFESGQLVVEAPADRPLGKLQVTIGPLVRDGATQGALWPVADISLWQVGMVEAYNLWQQDESLGWHPDPLLPLEEPLDVPAGQRQSILIRFFAAAELPAGTYRGEIRVSAAEMPEARLPVEATVWDFLLLAEQHSTLTIPIWDGQMEQMYPGSQTPQRRREACWSRCGRWPRQPCQPTPIATARRSSHSISCSLAWFSRSF